MSEKIECHHCHDNHLGLNPSKNLRTTDKIPANLTVRKGHHIFAFSCSNNSCIRKVCNKLVSLKNSLLSCYFANYYDSDASILRELKKKAFFRGILFEFTDNVPISCGKCNFGKTQNILESVRGFSAGTPVFPYPRKPSISKF